MVHWPEVIMTYDLTDKILFSADAFGMFGTVGNIFADQVEYEEEYLDEARRYYVNIVGKYGAHGRIEKSIGITNRLHLPYSRSCFQNAGNHSIYY